MRLATATALVHLALAAGSAGAQMLGTYVPGGFYQDRCVLDTPATASGDGVCPEAPFPMPPRAGAAYPAGAVTANHPGRIIFATDGVTDIIRRFHARTDCPGGPATLPPLPIPFPYNPMVAPLTGMTMDPATQTLYLTDGLQVSAHDPAAGMALVGGPWATVGLNFITGLDYDTCTGHLIAVSPVGEVAVFQIAGAFLNVLAITPWAHPAALGAGALATGVAIDRCIAWPCAGITPQTYVSWTTGQVLQSATGYAAAGALASVGLTFTGVPIRLPSPASCPGFNLLARTSGYVYAGAAINLELCNVPAGIANAVLGYSFAHFAGGIATPCGDALWLDPAAGFGIVVVPVAAGAAAVPIGPLPYGLRAYVQWAVVDPASGALDLSDALQLEVVRP